VDTALCDYFIQQVKEKRKVDISTRPKSIVKLMGILPKLKKTLATNKEAKRDKERHRDRERGAERERERDGERGREGERDGGRERGKEREMEGERERERESTTTTTTMRASHPCIPHVRLRMVTI
jgi:hypothetical protein